MTFVDDVEIVVESGAGGAGCLSFRREKFVPRGGPDGGNGGHGGSVYLVADPHRNTLLHFRYTPEHRAERGQGGEGALRTGRGGKDLEIPVPPGTTVVGAAIRNCPGSGCRWPTCACRASACSSPRAVAAASATPCSSAPPTAPRARCSRANRAKRRRCGSRSSCSPMSGLVGFPNAGKSTLIARASAARPKIADYPFTTLTPNLGVVSLSGERTFVIADVPGLIEGAHTGHGLGHQFLRHVERTAVLVHVVDVSSGTGRDPVQDLDIVRRELELFDPAMLEKPQLVAANKIDALDEPERLEALRASRRGRSACRSWRSRRPPAPACRRCSKPPGRTWPRPAPPRPQRSSPKPRARRRQRGDEGPHALMAQARRPRRHVRPGASRARRRSAAPRPHALALDEVRLVPSRVPPHRAEGPRASEHHRFAMAALAALGRAGLDGVGRRAAARRPVVHLRHADRPSAADGWTATQIFFLIGADAFAEIATWSRYPAVLDLAHFVVVARPGTTLADVQARVPALAARHDDGERRSPRSRRRASCCCLRRRPTCRPPPSAREPRAANTLTGLVTEPVEQVHSTSRALRGSGPRDW